MKLQSAVQGAFREKLKKIRFVAFDFDGVMTNGQVLVREDGQEYVTCSRRDGLGLEMLRQAKINACVISKEMNPVVTARCKKIKVECHQRVETGEGKLEILKRIMNERGIAREQVLYMGDDLNDLVPMAYVGVGITVMSGHPMIKQAADYITTNDGGYGAVREVCEMLCTAQDIELDF